MLADAGQKGEASTMQFLRQFLLELGVVRLAKLRPVGVAGRDERARISTIRFTQCRQARVRHIDCEHQTGLQFHSKLSFSVSLNGLWRDF